jgi:hypothetical protein
VLLILGVLAVVGSFFDVVGWDAHHHKVCNNGTLTSEETGEMFENHGFCLTVGSWMAVLGVQVGSWMVSLVAMIWGQFQISEWVGVLRIQSLSPFLFFHKQIRSMPLS